MKMNLPNKLTMLRVIMVPFFIFFLLADAIPFNNIIAGILFIIASLTDTLDGYIARKYNLITVFGKFMDPLADKLLVCSALICLTWLHRIPAWIVCVIIGREFIISGFRLIAAERGIVIAASWWGKAKTVSQMLMAILMIFSLGGVFDTIAVILMWVALVLTVISLVDYIMKNLSVLKDVH